MRIKTLLLVTLCTVISAGCEGTDPARPPQTATLQPTTQVAAPTTKQTAECVICVGHTIEVTPTTPHAEYAGKTYYFCSDYCKDEFAKDPEASLRKHAEAARKK